MERKPKKVEFTFDERSLTTLEECIAQGVGCVAPPGFEIPHICPTCEHASTYGSFYPCNKCREWSKWEYNRYFLILQAENMWLKNELKRLTQGS